MQHSNYIQFLVFWDLNIYSMSKVAEIYRWRYLRRHSGKKDLTVLITILNFIHSKYFQCALEKEQLAAEYN